MNTRDPKIDPQPGDELRRGGNIRRVIRREVELVYCRDGAMSYRIKLKRWQEWCGRSDVQGHDDIAAEEKK